MDRNAISGTASIQTPDSDTVITTLEASGNTPDVALRHKAPWPPTGEDAEAIQAALAPLGTKQGITTDQRLWREVRVENPTIIDAEERIVVGRINTGREDRYGTKVLPEGAHVEDFLGLGGPVLWNHNGYFLIGRTLKLDVGEDFIDATWQFIPQDADPNVEHLWTLYSKGWPLGYSIGFRPLEYEIVRDEDGGIIEFVFTEWDLVEFSVTPIPANPDAKPRMMDDPEMVAAWQALRRVDSRTPSLREIGVRVPRRTYISVKENAAKPGDSMKNTVAEAEQRAVVPYKNHPLADRDRPWSQSKAYKRIQKWAGYDGKDKSTVKWSKFKTAFVMFDRDNQDQFTGYKLLICDKDPDWNSIKAIPRAIFATAVVLQGGRGGVTEFDEGDIKKAKAHIARYYKKMGLTAPWDREADSFAWLPEELEFVDEEELDDMNVEELQDILEEFKETMTALQESMVELASAIEEHTTLLKDAPSGETPEPEATESEGEDVDRIAELEKEVEDLEQDVEARERENKELKKAYEILRETFEELGLNK